MLRKSRSLSLSIISDYRFTVRALKSPIKQISVDSSFPLMSAIVSSMKSNTVGSAYGEPSGGFYITPITNGLP